MPEKPQAAVAGTWQLRGDILRSHPADFATFEAELPQMNLLRFDDEIELRSWDHVPAGFVQTSAIYEHAATEALRRGWPVRQLSGTHLHPTLQPEETAAAIAAIARELLSRQSCGGATTLGDRPTFGNHEGFE
jgi:hypothetical protein